MLLQIPGLLEAPQLDKILAVLSETPLVAGRLSAGKAARAREEQPGPGPNPVRLPLLTGVLTSAMGHNRIFH